MKNFQFSIFNFQFKAHKEGFTLVEMIVALGIFLVAVVISVGSLLNLYNANNKSQSLSSVINNLNYSIEDMTRTIRFASDYHCGSSGTLTVATPCYDGDGSGVNDVFLAVTESGITTIFKYDNIGQKINRSTDNGATYTPITSSEVKITYAKFYTLFVEAFPDTQQPQVLIKIRGYAGNKPSNESSFDIQTMVSQRKLDL